MVTSGKNVASGPPYTISDDGQHWPKTVAPVHQKLLMLLEHLFTIVGQRPGCLGGNIQMKRKQVRRDSWRGHCKPTEDQTSTYDQACFTSQRTNSSFWHFDRLGPPPPKKRDRRYTICLGDHSLHKLFYRRCRARRGVHGHCKPTPSRPLCSFHPHQPAASSF